MILRRPKTPLDLAEVPRPVPGDGERLIEVECCAVCRTDLHVVDGELADPKLPLIPGHQVVGRDVVSGARVGVPWLAWTCGACRYCLAGQENLCDRAAFTGYTRDGGYAEYLAADARFCFPIPEAYSAQEAAPLLCAGLIGYRAYRMTRGARRLGLYGFGSAAHILTQLACADGVDVFAFTREGDEGAQQLALRVGAVWAGGAGSRPPEELEAAIIFAPVGSLVVAALGSVVKGGTVVTAGIHMSDIPSFPYSLLWGERVIRSVANLSRHDGTEFFVRLQTLRIRTERTAFPLEAANDALRVLRAGEIVGTAVLDIR
jgi:propanol-preferring alcohol dehydrogenase